MKKTLLFAASALIAGAFTSCSKDDGDGGFSQDISKKEYTLTGNMNEALLSRMTLGQNDGLYHWESKDSIWIWNADATQHVATVPTDINGISATFVFTSDFEPKYVTACSPRFHSGGYVEGVNPEYRVDVPAQSDAMYIELVGNINFNDFYKTSLPYFAQGEITKSSDGRFSFTLQHKLSYIYVKSVPNGSDGVMIQGANRIGYINAITGEVTAFGSWPGPTAKVGEYFSILSGVATGWSGIYAGGNKIADHIIAEPNKIYTIDRGKITVSGIGSAGQGPSDGGNL